MTNNQIADKARREEARHNEEVEREARRSNKEREKETYRSNKAKERELFRSAKAKETETERSNKVREGQARHSMVIDTIEKLYSWTPMGQLGSVRDKFLGSKEGRNLLISAAGAANDPWWYAQSPQLLKDTASVAYGYPAGTEVERDPSGIPSILNGRSELGVMTLFLKPTIGTTVNARGNAVQSAAQQLYTFVRHANSGHTNYEVPDLFTYLIAVDQCYQYWAFLTRAYGLINNYKIKNRYYPDAILAGQCLNYKDLRKNIAHLRAYINVFSHKIQQFAYPANLPYTIRHMWEYSHIYKDSKSDKAQIYQFAPSAFGKFIIDENGAGAIQWINFIGNTTSELHTFEDLQTFGDMLLDAIYTDEDFGIIAGDLLKAFGEGSMWHIPAIAEGYMVDAEESSEVLEQMQNSCICGIITSAAYSNGSRETDCMLWQDSEHALIADPIANNTIIPSAHSVVVTTHETDPGPETTIVNTRLIPSARFKDGETDGTITRGTLPSYIITGCGASCVERATVTTLAAPINDPAAPYEISRQQLSRMVTYANVTGDTFVSEAARIGKWAAAFDYFPRTWICQYTAGSVGDSVDLRDFREIMDTDNYTIIAPQTLNMMHDIAMYSMLSYKSY